MKRSFIKMICLAVMYMPECLTECKNKNNEENNMLLSKDQVIEKINLGKATVDEYKSIGIKKITDEYLEDINYILKNKNIEDISEIKKISNSAITSIIRINEGSGTLFNYKKIGIDVNSSNLEIINYEVKKERQIRDTKLSIALIKDSVLKINRTVYCSIAAINEGNGTIRDYLNLGINNVNCENLYDFNMFLSNRNIQTPNKIRNEINRFMTALEKIFNGSGTISNYKAIGIKLNQAKIKVINQAVKSVYENSGLYLNIEEIIEIAENISITYFGESIVNRNEINIHNINNTVCFA